MKERTMTAKFRTYQYGHDADRALKLLRNDYIVAQGITTRVAIFGDAKYIYVSAAPMEEFVFSVLDPINTRLLKGGKLLEEDRIFIKQLNERIVGYRWLLRNQHKYKFFLCDDFLNINKSGYEAVQSDLAKTRNHLANHNRLVQLLAKARKAN